MPDYGVTPTGFVRKPLSAILEDFAARQRATIDPNWSAEADELAGQYNGIFGDSLAQAWEVLEALDTALSREADDAALDVVGALNGTLRRDATKSKVELTVNLTSGTTVPAGSVVSVDGNPSVRVLTVADVTYSGGGSANRPVEAEAEIAGVVTANPSTLTVIETPVSGWNSVTNADPLVGGQEIEDDETYRLRQLQELAAGGGGSVPGLKADLVVVAEVTSVKVLENESGITVDGLPPHSVEAIVQGGDDEVVAAALFASKSGGIQTFGGVAVTLTDEQGVDHVVHFSRPTERRTYVAIGLTVVANYAAVATAVKQAIELAVVDQESDAFLSIGDDVYSSDLVLVARQVSGVLNAVVGVSLTPISDPADGDPSVSISDRELATIDADDIGASEL